MENQGYMAISQRLRLISIYHLIHGAFLTKKEDAQRKTEIIVQLLEQVAKGELSADLALERWPDIDSENDDYIAASWHDLAHFAADKDIRDKDPDYAAYQKDLLRERARKIREGKRQ